MSRDKQIEEMAKVIDKAKDKIWNDEFRYGEYSNHNKQVAEFLYNAGYRKADEVAREIFEEIDRMIYKVLNDRHYIMGDMCYEVFELKKKYTEGEG